MNSPLTDRTDRPVTLAAVDDDNWRAVADVAPRDDQRDFVAALAARYLLLSAREDTWTSLAVLAGDTVVGHVMWAYDEDDAAYWIGGMVIDAPEQGKGIGRQAVRALIAQLSERPDCREIRLSYESANTSAAALYTSLGFTPTGGTEGDEIEAALAIGQPTPRRD